MNLLVLAIRDRAADVFGQPIFVPSLGGAIRSFGDEVNRKDSQNNLANHPEDFDLYQIGVYDDNTGHIEASAPRMVAVGKDMVRG